MLLLLFGLLLILFGAALILFMPWLWRHELQRAYAAPRSATCPETKQQVGVTLDASHAATTGLTGVPDFRVADCTRWPARINCRQDCLPEVLRTGPSTLGEVHLPANRRPIHHLPVLLAAFAAWYLGMLWHSSYLFRAPWMSALGLSQLQWRQLVLWYSPHLLSIAVCLLFAYGVAWLQIWLSRQGFLPGILSSVALWAGLLVVALPSMFGISRDLLLIESAYTLLAAIIVGAVIGGFNARLISQNLPAK